MNNFKSSILPISITALLLFPAGVVLGRLTAETAPIEPEPTVTVTHETSESSHSHNAEPINVDAENAPTIGNLSVTKDAKAGWNMQFETGNFRFAPENASTDNVAGEGHAHLYIDGEKITRLYSNAYYIDHLDEGEHTVMVSLNANNHQDYAVNGTVISAMTVVTDTHHADEKTNDDTHMDSDSSMEMQNQ